MLSHAYLCCLASYNKKHFEYKKVVQPTATVTKRIDIEMWQRFMEL